jgi:lipoyl(octanoyl) transferase
VAAIGVAVRRWVTMHGLALNIDPNMEHFDLINPCGIRDRGVTSLKRLTGRSVPVREVAQKLAGHFSTIFDVQLEWVEPALLG